MLPMTGKTSDQIVPFADETSAEYISGQQARKPDQDQRQDQPQPEDVVFRLKDALRQRLCQAVDPLKDDLKNDKRSPRPAPEARSRQ